MADEQFAKLRTEPLAALARFAYDFAPHLCDPTHSCRNYHRAWSLVRHYEAGGALPLGIEFFRRELGLLAENLGQTRLRIMITAAADTGLAAMLMQALLPLGVEPEFVIVDRCNTTLMQQRMFLTIAKVSAEFIQGDAVTVEVAPVDAVIAHSFFGYVSQYRRPALFANWARQLRPAGRLLISERLAQESGLLPAWPDPAERQNRRTEMERKLESTDLSEADRSGFLDAADGLWDMTGKRSRMGIGDFRDAVTGAGLKIHSFVECTAPESVSPLSSRAAAAARPRHEIVVGWP